MLLKESKEKEKLELLGSCAKKGKPDLSDNNMLLKKIFNAVNSLTMCISGSHSFNPPKFSWDTHSKQSFRLDEEGFLWLSFCSFGP